MSSPQHPPPDRTDPGRPIESAGPVEAPATEAPAAAGRPPRLVLQARLLVGALALCALAVLFWPSEDSAAAPGGFLIDAGGRPAPIGERMAPVTLVHFWATWCPPCLTEVPSLQRLTADLEPYRGDFTLLMIAVDDDQERVEQFVGQRAASVLYDPQWEVTRRYGTYKLPETYLVVEGEVVEHYVGAQDWDDPEIRRQITAAVERVRPAGAPPVEGTS